MRYCARCITPETHDTISYDEQGVCSVCRQLEYKNEKIDWNARWQELQDLISGYKDKGLYDCILPYSGGKDSVFQLWYIVTQLKLKPLVVRFNHWGYRDLVDENNEKVFKTLGVDVIEYTPNWKVVRELMLESFRRRGDFCWHCHTGIYAGVIHMAIKFETPLIFWGESLAEYHSWYNYEEKEEVDEKRFNRAMNLGMTADDMYEFLQGRVTKRDLWMFVYPPRRETDKIKLKSICLGSYIKWDTRNNVEIIKREFDWKGQQVEGVAPEWDYEKIECKFQGMRDFSKFVKRGYGRTNHLVSIDIRNGRIDRDKGLDLAQTYDGKKPASMQFVLDILGITEDEYFEILSSHAVHPWKLERKNLQQGIPLSDMATWDRSGVTEPVGASPDEGGKKKYL